MSNTIRFQVDEITPIGQLAGISNSDSPEPYGPEANIVYCTMLDWFEVPDVIWAKLIEAISNIEGGPIDVSFGSSRGSLTYCVNKNSRMTAGEVMTVPIMPQLNPAITKVDILKRLQADPANLAITLFGSSALIAPTDRAAENDEQWGYIPSLCVVAEMLREGMLEIDGQGDIKLNGYAVPVAIDANLFDQEWLEVANGQMKDGALKSAIGRWFSFVSPEFKFGVIGKDLTFDDCCNQIEVMGKRDDSNTPDQMVRH